VSELICSRHVKIKLSQMYVRHMSVKHVITLISHLF